VGVDSDVELGYRVEDWTWEARRGHERKSGETAPSGRRNHPVGRFAAALARTALDSALRAAPPSLGDAAVLDDLDSIPPPEEAVETLVKPIAPRARHYEPVHGGVDIRVHVVVIPTASVHDVVTLCQPAPHGEPTMGQ